MVGYIDRTHLANHRSSLFDLQLGAEDLYGLRDRNILLWSFGLICSIIIGLIAGFSPISSLATIIAALVLGSKFGLSLSWQDLTCKLGIELAAGVASLLIWVLGFGLGIGIVRGTVSSLAFALGFSLGYLASRPTIRVLGKIKNWLLAK